MRREGAEYEQIKDHVPFHSVKHSSIATGY